MKNIHLLPTDKPSRLTKNNLGKFIKLNGFHHQEVNENQNIYITNDEKPKADDWSMYQNKIHKCIEDIIGDEFKKIILTTDQDLIKDGVQPIDDTFLEWFVNHSKCESIEVKKEMYVPQSNGKISDGKISHEISLNKEDNTLPWYEIIIPKEEPKQETLEEAALREYPIFNFENQNGNVEDFNENDRLRFIEGGKWQQEQDKKMYSEKDMKQFAWECVANFLSNNDNKVEMSLVEVIMDRNDKKFEQFKKK